MSAVDLQDLEFIWPSLGPTDVIVTGTFDKWSSSIHLVKGDGGFSGTAKVPWGQKIAYKYLVDGRWQCRDDRPQENDGSGNINNVLLTPEKPVLPTLTIPPEGGHGDVETMVTAVEFLTPAEPVANRGLHPLPIPQINVDFSQTPMVGEAKLVCTSSSSRSTSPIRLKDTAAATEGQISPASATPAMFPQESPDVPVDSTSFSLPPVDGNGVASDPEAPVSGQESVVAPPEYSPQATKDVTELADPVDVLSSAVVESTSKQQPEVAVLQQATTLTSVDQASTPSTQKKRRSFLARIKHIFDKNKDKEKKENKEKKKH